LGLDLVLGGRDGGLRLEHSDSFSSSSVVALLWSVLQKASVLLRECRDTHRLECGDDFVTEEPELLLAMVSVLPPKFSNLLASLLTFPGDFSGLVPLFSVCISMGGIEASRPEPFSVKDGVEGSPPRLTWYMLVEDDELFPKSNDFGTFLFVGLKRWKEYLPLVSSSNSSD